MQAVLRAIVACSFVAYILFFLSVLIGNPQLTRERQFNPLLNSFQKDGAKAIKEVYQNLEQNNAIDPANKQERLEEIITINQWAWSVGSIEKTLILRSLNIFDDPLLKNDTKPETLFEKTNMAFYKSLSLSIISLLMILILCVTLLSFLKNHVHYKMFALILGIAALPSFVSIFHVTKVFLSYYSNGIPMQSKLQNDPLLLLFHYMALVFSMISLLYLLYKIKNDTNLMNSTRQLLIVSARYTKDILLISGIALFASNLILLPLFLLQVRLPLVFTFSLILTICLLVVFYIYTHKKQNDDKEDLLQSFVFVIYRFIRGIIQFALFSFAFGVCTFLLLYCISMNIKILRNAKLIDAFSFHSLQHPFVRVDTSLGT